MKGMKVSVILALSLTLGLAMPIAMSKDVAATSQAATAQVEAAVATAEDALKKVAIGFAAEKAYLNGLIKKAEAVLAGEVEAETANLPELTAALKEGAQALIYRAGAAKTAAATKAPDTDMTTGATTASAKQAIATVTQDGATATIGTVKVAAMPLAKTTAAETESEMATETPELATLAAVKTTDVETAQTATIAAASVAAGLAALMTMALLEMVRRDENVCGVEAKRA